MATHSIPVDPVHNTLATRAHLSHTCGVILDSAQRLLDARSAWIFVYEPSSGTLVTVDARGDGAAAFADARIPSHRGIVGLSYTAREAVFTPDPSQDNRWFECDRVHSVKLGSLVLLPMLGDDKALGVLGLEMPNYTREMPPNATEWERLKLIARMAACSIRDACSLQVVEDDRQRLGRLLDERRHLRTQVDQLRDRVKEWHALEPLVGQSGVFIDVLTQVELVAPADSTVLLVGETGTGKERIAREVHQQSRRSGRAFVAVNCAALPEALVESELFGHEKGAFTGAFGRKPGKFELADHGTLFLDEVGDLPEPAQAKLLRVLQEREVQRVGGTTTVPVNVRLISATNHDLAACTKEGRFRPDLFYRLNVFPIHIPALRERPEDIPLLVSHFIRKFAERQHKPVPRLAEDVLERLIEYSWPGNIRELQNVIERAIILARGPIIGTELINLQTDSAEPVAVESEIAAPVPSRGSPNVIKFADAERHAILRALELAVWRISGRGGAADILGLRPTTLHAKMKRLGIRRPRHDLADRAGAVSGAWG